MEINLSSSKIHLHKLYKKTIDVNFLHEDKSHLLLEKILDLMHTD